MSHLQSCSRFVLRSCLTFVLVFFLVFVDSIPIKAASNSASVWSLNPDFIFDDSHITFYQGYSPDTEHIYLRQAYELGSVVSGNGRHLVLDFVLTDLVSDSGTVTICYSTTFPYDDVFDHLTFTWDVNGTGNGVVIDDLLPVQNGAFTFDYADAENIVCVFDMYRNGGVDFSFSIDSITIDTSGVDDSDGLFDMIRNFFSNFFKNLIDSIVSLFVPDEDYINLWVADMKTFFNTHFGSLLFPFEFIHEFLTDFVDSVTQEDDVVIYFPGIKWQMDEFLNNDDFAFISHPVPQYVTLNSNATFSVSCSGNPNTYQWQFLKDGESEWKNSTQSGYSTSTLIIKATLARDNQMYRCVVTDVFGNVITSQPAALIIVSSKSAIPTAFVRDPSYFVAPMYVNLTEILSPFSLLLDMCRLFTSVVLISWVLQYVQKSFYKVLGG